MSESIILRLLVTITCAVAGAGTAVIGPDSVQGSPPQAPALRYSPHDVPAAARPYNDLASLPRRRIGVVDSTGVRMFMKGSAQVNHPVAQAQYGLALLNTYRRTGDPWFLNSAARQARRLIDTHVTSRGAWWYPYRFDFPLSSGINNVMRAPWYSAMAQGQAMSLFVRLAEVTGAADWRTAADKTFASLTLGFNATYPWAVWRDRERMLWLEEYPGRTLALSARVLNGHLFATYGVWDYWRLTRSATAASLFAAALTTAIHYIPSRFRNAGWASRYSLRGGVPSEKYHMAHVSQLLHMHAMTGDATFAGLADALHLDFPPPHQDVTVRLAAGRRVGVRFRSTSAGTVTARREMVLGRPSSAPADQRRRILGQPGYWYRITAGVLRGYWVQENPSGVGTLGPVSVRRYFGSRSVQLSSGTWRGYTATRSRTMRLTSRSSAPVAAIGWIDGRVAVEIAGGALRGFWLPLRTGAFLH